MRTLIGVQWRREGIVSLCVALGCCAPGTQGHDSMVPPSLTSCLLAGSSVAAESTLSLAAGVYSLELVATKGSRDGRGTSGRLTLVPSDSSSLVPGWVYPKDNPKVTTPFWGWTTIATDSIGASSPLRVDSDDATSPGLLVWVTVPRRTIQIRIGQGRDLARGLRLDVLRIGPDQFSGTWVDDDLSPSPGGVFCAERKGSPAP